MTTVRTAIVGTKHAIKADQQVQTLIIGLRLGDEVELRRAPENPVDPNAVECWFRGFRLGFIPRRHNTPIAAAMDRGVAMRCAICDPAIIQRNPRGDWIKEEPRVAVEWVE